MDAFYPYITRTNTQPVEHRPELILPVSRYQRIQDDTGAAKKFRVGWQEQPKRQPKQHDQQHAEQPAEQQTEQDQHNHPSASPQEPATIEQQLHLIPTGHAVTPEPDLHPDADGHLDIYV